MRRRWCQERVIKDQPNTTFQDTPAGRAALEDIAICIRSSLQGIEASRSFDLGRVDYHMPYGLEAAVACIASFAADRVRQVLLPAAIEQAVTAERERLIGVLQHVK